MAKLAKITVSPLGASGGFAGPGRDGEGSSQCLGWTARSARSNQMFLRSVCVWELPPIGGAFTLTVGFVPSFDEWKALLRRFRRWFDRRNVVCWHYVIEWKANQRPHLHGCFFWHDPDWRGSSVKKCWLDLTRKYGTSLRAQHYSEIDGAAGWFAYMAKHASRGMNHYQRDKENIPKGWQKTGRMWSRSRDGWPTRSEEVVVTSDVFFFVRRSLDKLELSKIKTELVSGRTYGDEVQVKKALNRLKFLKRLRRAFGNGRAASEVRGINEWASSDIVHLLIDRGLERSRNIVDIDVSAETAKPIFLSPKDLPNIEGYTYETRKFSVVISNPYFVRSDSRGDSESPRC